MTRLVKPRDDPVAMWTTGQAVALAVIVFGSLCLIVAIALSPYLLSP